MATQQELLEQAAEIRDADQEGENTADRVGTLLINIIEAIGGYVSSADLNAALIQVSNYTEEHYAQIKTNNVLDFNQSPIVMLVSMGENLDGDNGAVVQEGNLYYLERSGFQIFVKGSSPNLPGLGYHAKQGVLYLNKYTGKFYEWTGSSMSEIQIAGTGGGGSTVTITKGGGYVDIDIIDNTPVIEVSTSSIVMSGDNKTATFTVSGHNLKGPISIGRNNAYFDRSPSSISPVGGIVEATTVTVTFGGTNDDTDDLTVSSPGATARTIHVAYTAVAGPNIVVSPASLSFKAATNQTQTKQVSVRGSLLTDDVEVTAGGAFQVSLQSGSGFADSVTIPKASALAGITVYVRYTAGSSATTGTLTLTSTGATPKTVDLTGAVNGTLSISPASASIGIVSDGSGTAQFTVQGANLTPATTASVEVSGTGMSADKQTLTVGQDGTINEAVTVTFSGSADSNGTLTVSHADVDDDATASIAGSIVTPLPANASFKVDGIHYKVNSDQVSVRVWNGSRESGAASTKYSGVITIPASVSDSGVTANLDGGGTQVGAGATYAVTKLAANTFRECSGLTSVVLPEGLLEIGAIAFYQCTNASFTSLTIPSTVTKIGGNFLSFCSKLVTVDMRCAENEDFQTTWGAQYNPMFKSTSALTSFVFPDNIVENRADNFEGCSAMRSITLGKNMTAVNSLFSSSFCPNVTDIICRGTTTIPHINLNSGTTYSIPQSVFDNATLHVPVGYKARYQQEQDGRTGVTLWSGFTNIVDDVIVD